jgi:integrase
MPKSASQAWAKLAKSAGVTGFRLHDLRHAHATHQLAGGTSVTALSDRLGHKNSNVTMAVYAHVLEEQKVEAVDTFAQIMKRTV